MSRERVSTAEPAPPNQRLGPLDWLRRNLFSTWYNSVLTVVLGYGLISGLVSIVDWAFVSASFVGTSAQDCTGSGACWAFISQRLAFFIYGFYPDSLYWRINIVFALLAITVIPQFIERFPGRKWLGIFGLTGFPIIAFILIHGGVFGLRTVPTIEWGGLTLTLVLAYGGMVASLPLGIVLALGRRSSMPAIRGLCTVFIEIWRAVPLITVLFMASVMLPLFLPTGVTVDKLLRAFIAMVIFWSAYLAEVVRGGLQAIPRGQYEAADALGLGYWQMMGLVILPQALKMVIPGVVNILISLFKDTSLVLIIGLFDLLGTIQSTILDPAWSNVIAEAYLFAAACYWVFTFGLSRYSQRLEHKLQAGDEEP